MELLFMLLKYYLYFMKILIEIYDRYFINQKTVPYDEFGSKFSIELVYALVSNTNYMNYKYFPKVNNSITSSWKYCINHTW